MAVSPTRAGRIDLSDAVTVAPAPTSPWCWQWVAYAGEAWGPCADSLVQADAFEVGMTIRPTIQLPQPGQESVWDYPRPPRLEATSKRIEVVLAGEVIADTREAYRVLETSHPPAYYLPPDSIKPGCLQQTFHESWCEWKGRALYFNVVAGDRSLSRAAWSYVETTPSFQAIQFYLAFYPRLMDQCRVNGEVVVPQPGEYYGGWITRDVVGPFKGGVGTLDW